MVNSEMISYTTVMLSVGIGREDMKWVKRE